ncbi:MAG: cytochrome-c oxidase, cbb3-type subunit III [Gammaproteobacteria bacterium]|nr:cytochrome-c oxidase, cbb3-type subunit III [Gammaproteobacteria bacterium]MDH5653241.1 cytochrome-c oxidase, cbb3-type subunit III [Gammaproteobacteria bacterium]
MSSEKKQHTVQTTGHAWDGDLQEFNNPLPNWWLWGFYATVVFAVIYWVLYPAFPIGNTYTKGAFNEITYTTADGKTKTSHWTTRALLMQEMQEARELQKPYLEKINKTGYEQIAGNKEQSSFAYSTAKVLFADNCAACHQAGGAGVIGMYPNLADDAWLWGGSYAQIEESIRKGRNGNMPGFKASLSAEQIDNVAEYVLGLSGIEVNKDKAAQGKAVFEGAGTCHVCHTKAGSGQFAMGSANLTDKVWTFANVPAAKTLAEKKTAVKEVVANGFGRHMPAWNGRLSDVEIKMLAFYVHQLSAGK